MLTFINKIFITIIFIFFTTSSFSQISFPELYCNNEKVVNDKIDSYFLPILFEFKFKEGDTIFEIKEGVIKFETGHFKTPPFIFNSNRVYTNFYAIGKSINITIKKLEVSLNGNLIRTDTFSLSKTIAVNHLSEMRKNEANSINDNAGKLLINNKPIDEKKKLSLNKKTKLTVYLLNSNKKEVDINYLDIVLVRGNRPVATTQSKSSSAEIGVFEKSVQEGDFMVIKVVGIEGTLFNKILFVK